MPTSALTASLALQEAAIDRFMLLGGLVDTHAEMWLWLALVLLIAEILTVGFFAAALAVASLFTACVAWAGAGPYWQLFAFSAFSIGMLLWMRPVFVRWLAPAEAPTNTSKLVGQKGTVTEQVPAGGHGRVKLTNEERRATAHEALDTGDRVTVTAVEGNTLTVTRG